MHAESDPLNLSGSFGTKPVLTWIPTNGKFVLSSFAFVKTDWIDCTNKVVGLKNVSKTMDRQFVAE